MQEMHMQLSEIKKLEWEEIIWVSNALYDRDNYSVDNETVPKHAR